MEQKGQKWLSYGSNNKKSARTCMPQIRAEYGMETFGELLQEGNQDTGCNC